MTPQQAKALAPIIMAFGAGKTIQRRYDYNMPWQDCVPPNSWPDFSMDAEWYRIKPEPVKPALRPWKPCEVPMGCILRAKYWSENVRVILDNQCEDIVNITFSKGNERRQFTLRELARDFLHSIDQGKTWQPCGVLIN
jgi:hypothetical protein